MGAFRKFVNNTRKPGGLFCIVCESDGTDRESKKYETIIDGMKSYTIPEIADALREAGFSDIRRVHHKSKPWIAVTAARQ